MALNQIAEALGKRPSAVIQDLVAQAHADLVDSGQIDPTALDRVLPED